MTIMKNEQAGLYIHIPFCKSKCGYCSFYSIKSLNLLPDFIDALNKEMKFYSKLFKSFDTVYLGGGTPSLLTPQQIETILKTVGKFYKIDPHAEITIEVNPGDVSLEYFRALRSLGINRLNIGIQSFDDQLLKFLGRRHSASNALESMENAREAGFSNIGLDLIYGVHHQNIKSWENTLQKAITLKPEHISCYQLSLAPKTPLYQIYQEKSIKLPSNEQQTKYFFTTSEILENDGYLHYEVSNFAREECLKSKHNMKYWQHVPYLGLGPAAHSFLDNKRWWNKAAVKTYLQEISAGNMPVENTETLSAEQLQLEALFLGLRTKAGIDLKLYKIRYGVDLLEDKKSMIDLLIKNKLVELKDSFLRPTRAGMAVADSLALI
jgi:oxygen-independent coproporphyrinogen-3 oxidase